MLKNNKKLNIIRNSLYWKLNWKKKTTWKFANFIHFYMAHNLGKMEYDKKQ